MKVCLVRRVAAYVVVVLALLGMGSVLPGSAQAADRWSDISDAQWEETYGITSLRAGLVADGYQDGSFRPFQAVTRSQFAKMAVRGLGLDVVSPTSPSFSDVDVSHPLYVFVESARAAGVIGGYEDGTFRPDAPITRQQANSILGRFLSEKELEVMGVIWGLQLSFPTLDAWSRAEGLFWLGAFSDLGGLAAAHRPTSGYLVYHQIVKGSLSGGKFWLYPTASLNRAQAVALVLRTLDAVGQVAPGPPSPPRDLATFPATPSAECRPWVSGKAVPGGTVMLFDTLFGSTRLIGQVMAHDLTGEFSVRVPHDEELVEGRHEFTLRVRSEKGLVSEFSARIEYVVDYTPPVALVSQPEDGEFLPQSQPLFRATAEDTGSGVLEVVFEYAVGGGLPFLPVSVDYTAPFLASWGALDLPDGAYLLRATAQDNAGNATISPHVEVIVDTAPPGVQLVAPLPAVPGDPVVTDDRTPYFAARVTDVPATIGVQTSGLAEVCFMFSASGSLPADPTVGSYQLVSLQPLGVGGAECIADWGARQLIDGSYVLACCAVDGAGNVSPLSTQEIVVDTAPPLVAVVAPTTGETVVGGSSYVVQWTAHDATLYPRSVAIDFSADDGATWEAVVVSLDNTGSYVWTVPAPINDLSACRIRVRVTDSLGREGSGVSGSFSVLAPV